MDDLLQPQIVFLSHLENTARVAEAAPAEIAAIEAGQCAIVVRYLPAREANQQVIPPPGATPGGVSILVRINSPSQDSLPAAPTLVSESLKF